MAYFHIYSESREYWKVLCGVHLKLNKHFTIQPHGFLFSVTLHDITLTGGK